MLKVGDTVKYNGADARITEVRNSHYVVYVTDTSGGYHTNIRLPDLETHEALMDLIDALDLPDYPETETDAKPTRYNKSGATLEVWDAIRMLNLDYMQGNILKYSYRYKDKNGPEDLVKAINYCIKLIANETGIDYYELHKLNPEELAKRIKK